MVMTIDATFENGVFVPAERPVLADHERVRLVVEPIVPVAARLEMIRRRQEQRIRVDPVLAREIALSAEFDPFGN